MLVQGPLEMATVGHRALPTAPSEPQEGTRREALTAGRRGSLELTLPVIRLGRNPGQPRQVGEWD